jgi:hypothetical protein
LSSFSAIHPVNSGVLLKGCDPISRSVCNHPYGLSTIGLKRFSIYIGSNVSVVRSSVMNMFDARLAYTSDMATVKANLKLARDLINKKDFKSAHDAAQQVLVYDPSNYNG